MALVAEKAVVTAREFLNKERNFNTCTKYTEPLYRAKVMAYNWGLNFSCAAIFCEIVWKISVETLNRYEGENLDRLFSVSPVATYVNFKGNQEYVSGNIPQEGALAIYGRGNGWQGHMGIVSSISKDYETFSMIEARVKSGDDRNMFIDILETHNHRVKQDFQRDRLNLKGFIYCKNVEF